MVFHRVDNHEIDTREYCPDIVRFVSAHMTPNGAMNHVRKRDKGMLRLAVLGVVVLLLSGLVMTSVSADDAATCFGTQPRASTVRRCSDWMSRLPDDALLSQLSLPGTHDSCALHNGLSFGFAKCQSWSLEDQLKAGIRFVDIRCRHVNNGFLIYHGIIDQQMTFAEVRDTCRRFLQQHPTETIVMSIKEESTPENNSRSFAATYSALTADVIC